MLMEFLSNPKQQLQPTLARAGAGRAAGAALRLGVMLQGAISSASLLFFGIKGHPPRRLSQRELSGPGSSTTTTDKPTEQVGWTAPSQPLQAFNRPSIPSEPT